MRTRRVSLGGSDWSILGTVPSEWRLRGLGTIDLSAVWPPQGPWHPATVPGDVQSDLVDAGVISDPRIGLASRDAEWTSARDWLYRRLFTLDRPPGARVELILEGVDERCFVFVDGTAVAECRGFAESHVLDITEALTEAPEHEVRILVEHAPMPPDAWGCAGWTGEVRGWKPRLTYGWDFAPRLVPIGLWGNVVLVVSDGGRLDDVHVVADADGRLTVVVQATGGDGIEVRLAAPDGHEVHVGTADLVAGTGRLTTSVVDAQLWWPAGEGGQPLYTVRTRLLDALGNVRDEDVRRTGFRTVRLLPAPHAPDDALPYQLEVNGRQVPIRGWNWVPVDILYGRSLDDRYRALLDLVADAHCNLLRVWGGGLPERDTFYVRCDESGILVWQDFLLSSSGIQNSPPTDHEHLALCRRAGGAMVRRLRSHPSLAMWCAGNELYDDEFLPEPPSHPVIGALAEIVADLDPSRPYLPGTPSGPQAFAVPDVPGHDVHGPWVHQGLDRHYEFHDRLRPLLHSEFGTSGATNLPALLRLAGDLAPWPPDASNELWVHRGNWWHDVERVTEAFGEPSDLEQYIRCSQLLQYDGLRYAIDAARRRWPQQAGTLPWQFNEPWPMAACSTAVDFWGHPKPAYWAVRESYAPQWISVQLQGPLFRPGEALTATVWASARTPVDTWGWALVDVTTGECVAAQAHRAEISAGSAPVGTIEVPLPQRPAVFVLRAELVCRDAAPTVRDTFVSTCPDAPLRPLHALQQATLTVAADRVTNTSAVPAVGVRVDSPDDLASPGFAVGYRPVLLGGESVPLTARRSAAVVVEAWNASALHATAARR